MNYKEYILEYFAQAYQIMCKLKLTENELLELDILKDGFDIEQLTNIMIKRLARDSMTDFKLEGNILYITCPLESDYFRSEMIKFISLYPTYEIKFIKHIY